MNKIAIIIPSRLEASRLPNKPLKIIKNKEMILHVHDQAIKSKSGDVYVATPNDQIIEVVKKHGGKAVKTSELHETGTDRIFEVFEKTLKKETQIIINLQGDMPNINPSTISMLVTHIKKNLCDIATLASPLDTKKDLDDPNVVKVRVNENLNLGSFVEAKDFFRKNPGNINRNLYHHIGIYAFTSKALIRYVKLKRSKLELERKLEQLRALENKMIINVGHINDYPLSVDTENDLAQIKKLMER